MLGYYTPPEQTHHPPPGAEPTQEQTTPPGSRPPPPRSRHPLPREADSSIRSMSGRYASYWNAFLFCSRLLTSPKFVGSFNNGTKILAWLPFSSLFSVNFPSVFVLDRLTTKVLVHKLATPKYFYFWST